MTASVLASGAPSGGVHARLEALLESGVRRPLLTASLLAGFVWSVTLLAITPVWQVNDDAVMAMIAAGDGIALKPDPHVVFTSTLIGLPLHALYRVWPQAPWYGLHLLLFLLAAQVALIWAALVGPAAGRRLGAVMIFLGTTGVYFQVNLQFSTTAFLVCLAGLVLATNVSHSGQRRSTGALVLACILVACGSLVRREGLWLALLGSVPSLALLGVEAWGRRRTMAFALLLVLAPAFLLWGVEQWVDARSPAWREYRRLMPALRRLIDLRTLAYTPDTARAFAQIGWTANDLDLVHQWFFSDPTLHSVERMERLSLLSTSPSIRTLAETATQRLTGAALRASFVPMALALPWLLWFGAGSRERQGALAVTMALAMAGTWVATALGHAPEHLIVIFLTFPATATLLLDDGRRRRVAWLPRLLLAVAATGVAWSLVQQAQRSQETCARNVALKRSLERLKPTPSSLYVAWGGSFPYEAILPLENRRYLKDLRLYSLGWPERTPIGQSMLDAFAIGDLFASLYSREDVRLISGPSQPQLLEAFGREHRGVEVAFDVEQRLAFRVYRGRKVRP